VRPRHQRDFRSRKPQASFAFCLLLAKKRGHRLLLNPPFAYLPVLRCTWLAYLANLLSGIWYCNYPPKKTNAPRTPNATDSRRSPMQARVLRTRCLLLGVGAGGWGVGGGRRRFESESRATGNGLAPQKDSGRGSEVCTAGIQGVRERANARTRTKANERMGNNNGDNDSQ
jgi:hypothetical protein